MVVRNRTDRVVAGLERAGGIPQEQAQNPRTPRGPESGILSLGAGRYAYGHDVFDFHAKSRPNWINAVDIERAITEIET